MPIIECEISDDTMKLIQEFARIDPKHRSVKVLCEQAIAVIAKEATERVAARFQQEAH